MPPRNPKPGETYRLDGPDLGIDTNALRTGTVVEVRELVTADTIGAHNDREDAVVVEWDHPVVVYIDDEPALGTSRRAISVGLDAFRDTFTRTEA